MAQSTGPKQVRPEVTWRSQAGGRGGGDQGMSWNNEIAGRWKQSGPDGGGGGSG